MDTQPNFFPPKADPPLAGNNPNPVPPHLSLSHWLMVSLTIIAIIGYFMTSYYYTLWPFQNLASPAPVPTFTPRPTSDLEAKLPSEVPADWQTYRNDEYGFEFKYPDKFTAYEPNDKRSVSFDYNTSGIAIWLFPEVFNPELLVSEETVFLNKIIINNKEWYFVNYDTAEGIEEIYQTQLPSGGIIQVNLGNEGQNSGILLEKTIRDQVLSTFKFIE